MTNTIPAAELRKLANEADSAVGFADYISAKAAYDEAANPSTMLALLDRLEELESQNKLLQEAMELDRLDNPLGIRPAAQPHAPAGDKAVPPDDDAIERAALEHMAPSFYKLFPGEDYRQTEQFKRLKEFSKAVLSRCDAGTIAQRKLRRGTTGVCRRARDCVCEQQGLGDECIWLVPAERREECGGAKESK